MYFDSLSNRDFQEKEDGLELRRKFRLRVYSPDADFALFEMKQKQGPYQRKRSLRLSRKEAQALIEDLPEAKTSSVDAFMDALLMERGHTVLKQL